MKTTISVVLLFKIIALHLFIQCVYLQLVDHMMAGIEDIAGYHGHHELRER